MAGCCSGGLRILLTSDSFYPPKGGGDVSLRTLAQHLSSSGHKVAIAYFGEKDPEFDSSAIRYTSPLRGFWPRHIAVRRALEPVLKSAIDRLSPDVVVTQQIALSPTIDTCHASGLPVIGLLRGVDFLCLGSYWSGSEKVCDDKCIGCEDAGCRLIQFPFFRMEFPKVCESLPLADEMVSNSEYTRRSFQHILGLKSRVINPPVRRPTTSHPTRESGSILFVSPVKHKGVDLAIELSQRLKDERFIFVGRTKSSVERRLSRLNNVEYIPWAKDMDSCYRASKLVIVPSVIPEGYGRVCSEALSRNVPCAVSAVGSLPDVVGNAGDVVRNHRDVDSWVEVVSRYSDPAYVREKSLIASERAAGFPTYEQHLAEMESLIMRCASAARGKAG